MNRGDIFIVSLAPPKGHEQQEKRPVLIVSPSAFNSALGIPVVLPITNGGNFAKVRGFAVPLTGHGLITTGIIRCDQPRALDIAARHGHYAETVPASIMDEVLARLATIFE